MGIRYFLFSIFLQTGAGTRTISSAMDTVTLFQGLSGRGVALKLRMSITVPLLPLCASYGILWSDLYL
jgi:hypothetical protein